MRLNLIPYFAAVCRWGTFSRAAEELHISQPAVSKAIRELEQDCGTALFVRHHSSISLTPAGRTLREGCGPYLRECEALERLAALLKNGRQSLRIGVVPMCGNTIFPQLHRNFLKQHSDVQISTVEDTASVLYGMLDEQELDLILCVTNHLPLPPYHCSVIKKSRLQLFTAPDGPLCGMRRVTFNDISGQPLVMFPDQFGQTRYIRSLFAKAHAGIRIMHQTSQVFTILSYIRSGAAVGFLSEEFAQVEKDLTAIPVQGIPAANINLVWLQDAKLHPALAQFVRFVKAETARGAFRQPAGGA